MLDKLDIEDILFLDIETVPQVPSYEELDETFSHLWDKKSANMLKEDQNASDVYERAGIYSEFGKIVCISCGFFYFIGGQKRYRVKSFYDDNEIKLLTEFNEMLEHFCSIKKYPKLCAHNGQEFDFPFIARRCLINGLKIPKILDIAGAKPWEVKETLIDTMQLWKFGDYKNFTSLALLCAVFDIPTPKDDIDGSQVASVYYKEKDLHRIAIYCEKDIIALARLFLKFKREEIFLDEQIEESIK